MNVRIVGFCHAFLLAASSLAVGQTPAPAPAPTEADTNFARSLAAMPPEQARTAIANADVAQITPGLARALRILGNSAARQSPVALSLYQESVQVAERGNDPVSAAASLCNEALAYRAMGNLEMAATILDRIVADYGGNRSNPSDYANALSSRALTRRDMGDVDGSIEDNHRALDMMEQLHDEIGTARVLNNLGNSEHMAGLNTEAREHFELGLRIAREHKQRLGEAFLLNNIADTYLTQNNPTLAADYCLQAIKIKEELGAKDELSNSLVDLARIYHQSGNEAAALETAQRATTFAQQSGRPQLIGVALLEEGIANAEDQRYETSMEKLNESLAVSRKGAFRAVEYAALAERAEVEYNMKRYADAARDGEEAMSLSSQLGLQATLADASSAAGHAQHKLGHTAESRADLQTSIATVELMRDNIAGGDAARAEFFAHRSDTYQDLVALDADDGQSEAALLTSEREKGRALLDLLTQGKVSLASQLTPAEATEEKHLRVRLSGLEVKRSAAAADAAVLASINQQLVAARAALSSFKERMYAVHPELGRHRGNAPLITLPQVAQFLKPSTAILEYEVTPSATYLFAITSGRDVPTLHVYAIPIAGSALKARVNSFRAAIARRDPDFAAPAAELYRLLIAPAKSDLAGKHALIIVPSGDLWHLPFQALKARSGKYLIDNASISYAPSLSVLRAYSQHARSANAGHAVLAFGDPAGDMPEAVREVQTLTDLYGATHVRSFTGTAASKANFSTYAAHYDVVHLATHGVVDDINPMYSHLVFASTSPAQSKLSQLDASEIAETNLSASLVVLSACETAGGQYQNGDGLIGLTSAFLAAGSQSAVASQWRVESSSTTELMIALHRGLQLHLNKAQALQQAELSVARQPRYRHPFYWAGFVLLGEN